MVQKSGIPLGVWYVIVRIILFCVLVWVAAKTSTIALAILKSNLGYRTPDTLFDINLADPLISFLLTLPFWCGVLFGFLGRKIDYVFTVLICLFSLYGYYGTETVTAQMYLGLLEASIIGNAIGFGLKFLRQKFLPKLKV